MDLPGTPVRALALAVGLPRMDIEAVALAGGGRRARWEDAVIPHRSAFGSRDDPKSSTCTAPWCARASKWVSPRRSMHSSPKRSWRSQRGSMPLDRLCPQAGRAARRAGRTDQSHSRGLRRLARQCAVIQFGSQIISHECARSSPSCARTPGGGDPPCRWARPDRAARRERRSNSCRRWSFAVPIVAADVDGQLRELTFPIQMDCQRAADQHVRIRTAR